MVIIKIITESLTTISEEQLGLDSNTAISNGKAHQTRIITFVFTISKAKCLKTLNN